MYFVTIEKDFDAAHCLRGYQGKCEAMHGHRFVVRVTIKASTLNNIGLAFDFTVLKEYLGDILSQFDHTNLNEVEPFKEMNPSSENLALIIHDQMRNKLTKAQVTLDSVEVWESPTSHVTYRQEY
jgi:6-pyruvoyltetrahydropterin/6-carboxytetrahydropterin synthase